jgi:hypothetical protein
MACRILIFHPHPHLLPSREKELIHSFYLFFSLAPWWERIGVRGIPIFILICYHENGVKDSSKKIDD